MNKEECIMWGLVLITVLAIVTVLAWVVVENKKAESSVVTDDYDIQYKKRFINFDIYCDKEKHIGVAHAGKTNVRLTEEEYELYCGK